VRLLLRAERPSRGSVRFLGCDVGAYTRAELVEGICHVGQFPEQQIVLSSVEEYRERAARDGNAIALRLLDSRFPEGKAHPLAVLSPLELKLLLLASSAGAGTRLIILDEPTWGIDVEGQAAILETLLETVSEIGGAAVLAVSHDASFLKRLGAELLILENGRLRRRPGNGST
jgi:ABC-type cobalamin/Fe3+-siderophores transport system ATPase subunit